MKSKLPNEDELFVKYILRELDPSEEVLVEQAMLDDENALIEVESLRNTFKKLQSLPSYDAPQHLLNNIIEQSASTRITGGNIRPLFNFRRISYAAAASLLIAGGATWYTQSGDAHLMVVTEDTTTGTYIAEPNSSPWIDKRDIMHVSSFGAGTELIPDTVMQRLRPIDAESAPIRPSRQLQLTGAQN